MTSYALQIAILSTLGDRNNFNDRSKMDRASAKLPRSASMNVHAVTAATFLLSASSARLKHRLAAA
jgi:hypothetical protein